MSSPRLAACALLALGWLAPGGALLAAAGAGRPAAAQVPQGASYMEQEIAAQQRGQAQRDVSGTQPPASTQARQAAKQKGGLSRCVDSAGTIVFTDQRCGDLSAADSPRDAAPLAPATAPPPPARFVRSCARNHDDLLFGVRGALEDRDVNRLAGFYHWPGLGTEEGYRLMARLGAFVARPLADVQLISNREREMEAQADSAFPPAQEDPDLPMPETEPGEAMRDEPKPRPERAAAQVSLLRVQQFRDERDLSMQVTHFHLRSNAGCWWLQF